MAAVGEKRADLNQVAAVGIDRVAREATLLLEIGKELEHKLLEGDRARERIGPFWSRSGRGRLGR